MDTREVDAVDIGPITLADAMRARDVLERAGEACAPLAAMLALRIAQYEAGAVRVLADELEVLERDTLLPPAVPADVHRPDAFPCRRGVPSGRWE